MPETAGRAVQVVDERVVREGDAAGPELVTADDVWLRAHDVRWWAGPRSLPLWLPAEATGFARRSGARFRELGGLRTTLRATVERVHDDEVRRGLERERRSGLGVEEKQGLVRELVDGLPTGSRPR